MNFGMVKLEDSLVLESIGVEIAISELYRQVQFEIDDKVGAIYELPLLFILYSQESNRR
jgi:hypothetical protein